MTTSCLPDCPENVILADDDVTKSTSVNWGKLQQQATTSPFSPTRIRLPSFQGSKRRHSLPCVNFSPRKKHFDLMEYPYHNDYQEELVESTTSTCICSICFVILLMSHLVFWLVYRQMYIAFIYFISILIHVSSTLWVYVLSRSPAPLDGRLFLAISMQFLIFNIFSLFSFGLLCFIISMYATDVAFQELLLWRKAEFTLVSGLFTFLEFAMALINVMVTFKCRQELMRISKLIRLSWERGSPSMRDWNYNRTGEPPHSGEETTVYYLDNIPWSGSFHMDSMELEKEKEKAQCI